MNYEKLAAGAVVSKTEKQKVWMPGQVQLEIVILLLGQRKLRFTQSIQRKAAFTLSPKYFLGAACTH